MCNHHAHRLSDLQALFISSNSHLQLANCVWLTCLLCLVIFITGCSPQHADNSSQSDKLSMGSVLGHSIDGYTEVTPDRQINFPADHQAHDDYRQEWWYLTANLTTESGELLGLQWTQFRVALSPPDSSQKSPQKSAPETTLPSSQLTISQATTSQADEKAHTPWATQQLYMAHAALTSSKQHYTAEQWSRAHPSLAAVQNAPFAVSLNQWQWLSEDQNGDMFPATLSVNEPEFGYQLKLSRQAPYQRQGDKGYSTKSADNAVASYYYSQPYIEVSGQVIRQGKVDNVSGIAWLDREWSSQFLTKAQQGWDWFSIRLNDVQTLMIFQLRRQDEQSHFYSARLMHRDGSGKSYSSQTHPDLISMQPTKWTNTALGKHPTQWHIRIADDAGGVNIDIHTRALNPQSDMPLSVSYWEGPIEFSGTHQGSGYMELTGY